MSDSPTWVNCIKTTKEINLKLKLLIFHPDLHDSGYIPRDNLDIKHDVLDWHGDHLFSNYHTLYDSLTGRGYYVEILSSPLTCFDANQYGALMIVDSEEEWYPEVMHRLSRLSHIPRQH